MSGNGYDAFRVTGFVLPIERSDVSVAVVTPAETEDQARLLTMTGNGYVRSGESYTVLRTSGRLQMSDTRDEYRDHSWFIHQAHGRVLIHGLGLGCCLKAILAKDSVTHIDVIEKNTGVVEYVGQFYTADPRVNIVCADAFDYTWPSGSRWDVVWHDIWPDKCEDDLAEHTRLLRSFGRRAGWQGAWAHEELLRYRRHSQAWAW